MTKTVVFTSAIALLITCLLAPIFFYLGPIPMTLQTLILFMTASVFGKRTGLIVSIAYLALGAAGLPVFAAWQGGYEHLLGKTAGFLWAFPLVCYYLGWQVEKGENTFIHLIIYFFRAHIILLIPGALVAYGSYGGELFQAIIRLMPGLLIKTIVGGLASYWILQKLPLQWTEVRSSEY